MFAIGQFEGRKRSQCEALEAFADLLIVTGSVKTIKRGSEGRGERKRDREHEMKNTRISGLSLVHATASEPSPEVHL